MDSEKFCVFVYVIFIQDKQMKMPEGNKVSLKLWTCNIRVCLQITYLMSVISLNVYSRAWNRKLFRTFYNSQKTSSRLFKKIIRNKIIKRFLGKATSQMINMGGQRAKIGGNWPLTGPYLQCWTNLMGLHSGALHSRGKALQFAIC